MVILPNSLSRNRLVRGILACWLLAISASAFAAPAKPPTSPHGIIINHQYKVKELGLSCDSCHNPSTSNPSLMGFPTMDTCATCHADETDMAKGTDKCAMCHTNADYSSTVRKDKVLLPDIKFSHVPHAAAKVECLSCHSIYNKVGVTGNEMLPTMNTCITCHKAKNVPKGTDCATCHVNQNIGTEKPANHTGLWIQIHGRNLSQSTIQTSCNTCHTVASGNDCNSCHQREAPKNHTATWTMKAHGLAARADRNSCATCHTEDQCITCHTSQKPSTHNYSWGSVGGNTHCYTCHFENNAYPTGAIGSNCTVCHSSASVLAKHESVNRIAGLHPSPSSSTCTTCHSATGGLGGRIPHPYPNSSGGNAQCATCHPYQ